MWINWNGKRKEASEHRTERIFAKTITQRPLISLKATNKKEV